DLMPRKIESRSSYEGAWEEQPSTRTFVGTYTKMHVNANPAADTFVLKAGRGDTTVTAEPEDLGIPGEGSPKLKFAAGDAAPDFALKGPDGTEVTLAGLKGRVVLL